MAAPPHPSHHGVAGHGHAPGRTPEEEARQANPLWTWAQASTACPGVGEGASGPLQKALTQVEVSEAGEASEAPSRLPE